MMQGEVAGQLVVRVSQEGTSSLGDTSPRAPSLPMIINIQRSRQTCPQHTEAAATKQARSPSRTRTTHTGAQRNPSAPPSVPRAHQPFSSPDDGHDAGGGDASQGDAQRSACVSQRLAAAGVPARPGPGGGRLYDGQRRRLVRRPGCVRQRMLANPGMKPTACGCGDEQCRPAGHDRRGLEEAAFGTQLASRAYDCTGFTEWLRQQQPQRPGPCAHLCPCLPFAAGFPPAPS